MDKRYFTVLSDRIDVYNHISDNLPSGIIFREDKMRVLKEDYDHYGNMWIQTEVGWILAVTNDKKCNVYRHY